jgi:dihydroxyacid dehydratase/phosphogluconate dehydratase
VFQYYSSASCDFFLTAREALGLFLQATSSPDAIKRRHQAPYSKVTKIISYLDEIDHSQKSRTQQIYTRLSLDEGLF